MPEFVLNTAVSSSAYDALDDFAKGFIEAAFFTEICHGNEFTMSKWWNKKTQHAVSEGQADGCLPSDCGVAQLHPDAIATIAKFCSAFQVKAAKLLQQAYERDDYDESQAGRDLWFTYNGHGVGYWDREQLENDSEEYERLTAIMVEAGANSEAWNKALAKRSKIVSLGDKLSKACGRGEFSLWFGDHVEHGNKPFIHATMY